jgi:hypothetical protein
MEQLMELVAASFARHGIDCPKTDCPPQQDGTSTAVTRQTAPVALPEHNFRPTPSAERQHLQGDPAP